MDHNNNNNKRGRETSNESSSSSCCPFVPPNKRAAADTSSSKLAELVKTPGDILTIFGRPVKKHHVPYHSMKLGHDKRLNAVYHELLEAGESLEDGIAQAKELVRAGENPDLMRHAFGIYLTHSRDAQSRCVVIPPLKNHAVMVNAEANPPAKDSQEGTYGQVITADTFQGPELLSYWQDDYDDNDHHVHWHMVFPGTGVVGNGKNVPVIDRQGELFL